MLSKRYVLLALVIMATGILLPPDSYAGGRHNRHGHGYHYDDSFYIALGLGFVLPLFAYGYPYYAQPPVYSVPTYMPPPTRVQRSYAVTREEPAYCREYTKKVLIEGKEEVTFGTACLQDDGRWRIMN